MKSIVVLAIGIVCFGAIGKIAFSQEVIDKKLTTVQDTMKSSQKMDTIPPQRPIVKTRANSLLNRDTAFKVPYTFSVFTQDTLPLRNRFTQIDLSTTNERSAIEASKHLIGIYPHHYGIYGQPAHLAMPCDPQQMKTIIFERENNDPIHFRTPSELLSIRGLNYMANGMFEGDGEKLFLEPTIYNPKHSLIKIDYRNGYYALGRADVRFFQPISEATRWGFATTVSQGDGRYLGADVNETNLFFHYRYLPKDKIHWFVNLRQNIEKNGVALRSPKDRIEKRSDLDISIRSPLYYPDVDTSYRTLSDSLRIQQFIHWRINFFWSAVERRWFLNPIADGRRIGGMGKITINAPLGNVTLANTFQEFTALLPNRGKHKLNLNETNLQWMNGEKLKVILEEGLLISKSYKPSYAFSFKTVYHLLTNLNSSLSYTESVRFPSFEEKYSYLAEPRLERFFDKPLYLTNRNTPYLGNPKLLPVTSKIFSFVTHWQIEESSHANFYFAFVRSHNPIQTFYNPDTGLGYFTPLQKTTLKYAIYGTKWNLNFLQWGFTNGALNGFYHQNRKETFLPDAWGLIDFGLKKSIRNHAAEWQGLVRIRHIGERYWVSQSSAKIHSRVTPIDLLFSLRIYSLRINWGITNLARETYEELPGYPAMHREEVWGVNWNLWD